nr:hypothetical protein KPHV_01090 [Kitasatospora purpeofusca]
MDLVERLARLRIQSLQGAIRQVASSPRLVDDLLEERWAGRQRSARELERVEGIDRVVACIDELSPRRHRLRHRTVPGTTKSVARTGGGPGDAAKVGDVLEYSVVARNGGGGRAEDVVLEDVVPKGTRYAPGSLKVGADGRTDRAGDDTAKDAVLRSRLGEQQLPVLSADLPVASPGGVPSVGRIRRSETRSLQPGTSACPGLGSNRADPAIPRVVAQSSSLTRPQASGNDSRNSRRCGSGSASAGSVSACRKPVELVLRQSLQYSGHALHHLRRGVGSDLVVLAGVQEPEGVEDQPGENGHQRVHVSHSGNLPDPQDNKNDSRPTAWNRRRPRSEKHTAMDDSLTVPAARQRMQAPASAVAATSGTAFDEAIVLTRA